MSAAGVLSARGLGKQFPGSGWVLQGVDLDLRGGEVLALLGPNGAGKTTLAALALGLLLPDAGEIQVLGQWPGSQACRRVGWVGEGERSWFLRLSAEENLVLWARLHGLRGAGIATALQRAWEVSELHPHRRSPVADLSAGMRARLALARATLHQPHLLILDEPFAGLDVGFRARLGEILRDGNPAPGVLLISHEQHLARGLADRVAFLQEGVLQGVASAEELAGRVGDQPELRYLVTLETDPRLRPMSAAELREILEGVVRVERVGEPDLRQVPDGATRTPPPCAAPGPAVTPRGRAGSLVRGSLALLRADLRHELSYPLVLAGTLASAALLAIGFMFISRILEGGGEPPTALAPYRMDYFPFVLVGLAFAGFQTVAATALGNALRTRQLHGTLPALLATPAGLGGVLLGGCLWPLGRTTLVALVTLGCGMALGVRFPAARWEVFGLALVLTLAASLGLGLCSAAFLLRFQRGDPITALLGLASALLGGIYFPPELLPGWLQAPGELLPVLHGLRALRLTLVGEGLGSPSVAGELWALILLAALTIPVGLLALRIGYRRARRRGTLGRY